MANKKSFSKNFFKANLTFCDLNFNDLLVFPFFSFLNFFCHYVENDHIISFLYYSFSIITKNKKCFFHQITISFIFVYCYSTTKSEDITYQNIYSYQTIFKKVFIKKNSKNFIIKIFWKNFEKIHHKNEKEFQFFGTHKIFKTKNIQIWRRVKIIIQISKLRY